MKAFPFVMFFAAILLLSCVGQGPAGQVSTGKVYFSITDKKLDMANVSSVKLTIDSIKVHMTEAETQTNETQTNETETSNNETESSAAGWVTVLNESKTYDLLELSGIEKLLSTADLEAGTYNIIRLYVSNAEVVLNGQTEPVKLPSGKIDIPVHFTVAANSTSLVGMDFNLNDSLHITGDGKVIMAPVIKVEIDRNVQVDVQGEVINRVRAEKESEKQVGTDINGTVGEDKSIAPDENLTIDNEGRIIIVEKPHEAVQHDVDVRRTGLSPSTLTVQRGDSVRWIFRDSFTHRLVSSAAGMDSGARYQDQVWSFTFNNAGTFVYRDDLATNTTGTITVQ